MKNELQYVLLAIGVMSALCLFYIYDDYQIKNFYQETRCLVVENKSAGKRSNIQLKYLVNNIFYISRASDTTRFSPVAKVNQEYNYAKGKGVACWYDTRNPNIIKIDINYNFIVEMLCIFVISICILYLVYFVKPKSNTKGRNKINDINCPYPIIIKSHLFTNEYIRNYHVPLNMDKLPPEITKYGDKYKRRFLNDLIKEGSFISITQRCVWLMIFVMFVIMLILGWFVLVLL